MGDDDQRKADWWHHEYRKQDWKDQQERTQRELDNLRNRNHWLDDTDRRKSAPEEGAGSVRLSAHDHIQSAYTKILVKLKDAHGLEPWRARKWHSALGQINPSYKESADFIEAIALEIKKYLDTTTDWELGRRCLGTGMGVRSRVDDIRSDLVLLSIDVRLDGL